MEKKEEEDGKHALCYRATFLVLGPHATMKNKEQDSWAVPPTSPFPCCVLLTISTFARTPTHLGYVTRGGGYR